MRTNRNISKTNLGLKIREERIKQGYKSQLQFAKSVNIGRGSYAELEAGYNIKLTTLETILDKLNLKIEIVPK